MTLARTKPMSAPRRKKCRVCREWFRPATTLQIACSPRCALTAGREQRVTDQKRRDRKTREALKTKHELTKEAQAEFNAWIRERDHDQPCISCGRTPDDSTLITGSYWHAGHFRSRGANPELRFDPLNTHKQCSQCNNQYSGNVTNYRIGLRTRIGDDALEWLEGPHEPKHYSKDDLRQIRDHYRREARRLKKDREQRGSVAG